MPLMWQYQQLAELPPANSLTGGWEETITLDQWEPRLPDIRFQLKYLSEAIMPDISMEPRMVSWLKRITLDKWAPCLPAKRYEKAYLLAPNQLYFYIPFDEYVAAGATTSISFLPIYRRRRR